MFVLIFLFCKENKIKFHLFSLLLKLHTPLNFGKVLLGEQYINRELAAALAPLLDKGATIASRFMEVTGGGEPYLNYGLNLELRV